MSKEISTYKYLSVLTLVLLTLSISIPVTASNGGISRFIDYGRAYVSPLLLEDEFWLHGAYIEDPELLSFPQPSEEFTVLPGGQAARVIIVMDRRTPVELIRGKVVGLTASLPTHLYRVVSAVITRDQLEPLTRTPGVLAVLPDIRMDALINRDTKTLRELLEKDPYLASVLQASSNTTSVYHYTVEITGAWNVWTEYNVRGENITIAIIDTGVDYGSPGLGVGAIARDEYGLPLVFDASSLGLVLTPVEAVVGADGFITVNVTQLYLFQPPYYVFKWNASLFVRITGCRSATIWVPFPAGNRWFVGNITPPGSRVRFGLAYQVISFAVAGVSSRLDITIPVLLVDRTGDGLYDTLYVDTTTALNLTRMALAPAPCSVVIPGTLGTVRDFSFADEMPIHYGNEVVARDLDGDGLTDYSIGTLAGYVYDAAFAIIMEKIGEWERLITPLPPMYGYSTMGPADIWRSEPVALIWPGLDPHGDYVVIQYDYSSHGTFCATTAAGRDFYAQTGYGVRSISGQAPAVKIASSPALYYGTVAVSIYFFSGFDITTPYADGSVYLWPTLLVNPWIAFEGWTWNWEYLGIHQVDVTSNSYGASGWALWGWNTGADPSSVIFDYTILVSGTPHFVAVGNGGPGSGTIASPAGSSLAISVGAATEFTYRPAYLFHWPGSSRQVIAWSNRGPTELGVVKPDIVGVGSFAWAIGRTWDALNNLYVPRHLRGNGSFALFSGTSQATPMVAGASALVASMYKQLYNTRIPPHLLKTIIMNYAYDMGFDELAQGSGFIDAYSAVKALVNNYPRIYSRDFLGDVVDELTYNYRAITYDDLPTTEWYEPKIFIPMVRGMTTRRITLEGSGTYRLYSTRLELVETIGLCNVTTRNLNPTIITSCIGDTLTFNVTAATLYGHLVLNTSLLSKYDYFEIELIYPFSIFETGGRVGAFNVTIPTSVLELAYWIDFRADDVFFWNETGRIFYDIRRANVLRVQIGDLEGQIREIETLVRRYIGIEPTTLPRYLVARIGVSGATYRGVLPIRARVVGYKYTQWGDVTPFPSRVTVDGSMDVVVIVRAPQRPGFYSGYIVVEEVTRGTRSLVPISFFVPIEFTREAIYTLTPFNETTIRKNTYLIGAFDYTWRYESGDWRVFKVVISPSLRYLWALGVKVTWPTHGVPRFASNLDVHFYGPYVYYMVNDETSEVYEYVVNTVQLAAELSRDPAGGGGFNPTRFWDTIAPGLSMIISPIPMPGVYRVIVRNIQFAGLNYTEPFTLELIPVMARVTLRYSPVHRGYLFTVNMTTPEPLLLNITSITPTVDGILYNETGVYYISSLLGYGLNVTILSINTTTGRVLASILVRPTTTLPTGIYVIPINITTRIVPVTSIGWISAGVRTVYFEWRSLPILLRLRI